jgi:glutamine---fructose-6-phosphate transaminase (isomerizing)
LVIGIGDGEGFLASDAAVFVTHTREAADVGADHVVTLQRDGAWVTDLDGVPVDVPTYRVDASTAGSGDEAGASTGGGSR